MRPLGNALFSRQTPSARLPSPVPPVWGVGEFFFGQEIFYLPIVGDKFELGPAIINTFAFGPPKFKIVFCQCVFSGVELANGPVGRRRGPNPDDSKELDHLISPVGERCTGIETVRLISQITSCDSYHDRVLGVF